MQPGMINGATRVVGKSQGYIGLPIRDEQIDFEAGGQITIVNQMVTAWFPTPDEVERINGGAPIYLMVLGQMHQPTSMKVGDPIHD